MRKLNWRQWSLAVKLTLIMTIIIVVITSNVTLLSIIREQQAFRVELQRQAELILDTLSVTVAAPLYNLDLIRLSDIAERLGETQTLVFGRVYDPEGRIIADAYDPKSRFHTEIDPLGERLVESDTVIFEWQSDRLVAGQAVLAGHRRVGAISIGLSMTPLQAKVAAVRNQGLGIALIATAVGMLLTLLVSRSITGPLREMVRATKRVIAGDLEHKIAIRASDEIGVLAHSFNSMTSQLQQTLKDMENRTRDLTLAVDVGRRLSTVRDLDILLAEAVELIRAAFDLYYTQIYLTDAAERILVLITGTGTVGKQLVQHGHCLMIGPGSINGVAAAEKRAVVVADTSQSETFLPNPFLPDTRSEMAVPLIAGDHVVGVLNLQHNQLGTLIVENLPAFEALAGQLAIAIENANLFVETAQARAEVEAYAHHLTRTGWEEFFNAVDRSEQLGYTYDLEIVSPLAEALPKAKDEHTLAMPVAISGEPIGMLQLESEPSHRWTSDEAKLVTTVARQVAQQVENLRLLTRAEQHQAEAEQVARRLTREGWQAYIDSLAASNTGYSYDLNQVTPLSPTANGDEPALARPLTVHGETIGELAIAEIDDLDDEATELLTIVAGQLSEHIENARLLEETERGRRQLDKRAAELQTVAEVSATAVTVLETDKLLQTVVDLTKSSFGLYHAHIYLLDDAGETLVLTAGAGEVGRQMVAQGWQIPLERKQSLVARAARTRQGIIVGDVRQDPNFLPNPLLPDTRSEMAVPLIVGDKVLGVLDVQADAVNRFTGEDVNIQTTLAGQIASTLQNANLFAEIQQTAERLREVDRLKSEFLANMSHELRTPLNSIIGYSEMMLMGMNGDLDPDVVEDIQAIYDNGKHLLHVISDILDLAKIEAGRLNLHIEEVSLGSLLDEVKTNNASLLVNKPIEMIVEVEEDLPLIEADPVRINQILNNLISNAVKFTEKGFIDLRAFYENGWVCVEVEDTGAGIAEDDLNEIFEKFRQVDGSFTRRAEGTGLGLAITRHLVEMHGGTIDVRSQLGQGTTFTVRLPVERGEEANTAEIAIETALAN